MKHKNNFLILLIFFGLTLLFQIQFIYFNVNKQQIPYFTDVINTSTIPTITSPGDLAFDDNEIGYSITWIATDVDPTYYIITRENSLGIIKEIDGGTWMSDQEITISLDGLGAGGYEYSIIVYDMSGESATDTVYVKVRYTGPPIVTDPTQPQKPHIPKIYPPSDIYYEEGEIGNYINWIVTDDNPTDYIILKDDVEIDNGTWSSSTPITINIDELSIGTYIYTLVVYDGDDFSPTDSVNVIVVAPSLPSINSPEDISYNECETGYSITWIATDGNPAYYIITKDDVEVDSGTWRYGEEITINIDGLIAGIYEYTIIVFDQLYNSANDIVIVNVASQPPSITSPEDISFDFGETGHSITWIATDPNPTYYIITREHGLGPIEFDSGTWTSGQEITINLNGLPSTKHTFTIVVYDIDGEKATDIVYVAVYDTDPGPPTIEDPTQPQKPFIGKPSPADIYYEEGETGNYINWYVKDNNPTDYIITKDGVEVDSGAWSSNTPITIDVDDLSIGTYIYTLVVNDGDGYSLPDSINVIVVAPGPPSINSPEDISYNECETGNLITWIATDGNPAYYIITKDDVEVDSGTWRYGEEITINIDGLVAGIYEFEIIVYDQLGNSIIDIVIINVIEIIYQNGDVNHDGNVDIVDALLIAQYYVELNPSGFYNDVADVNYDGLIDIIDALLVAQAYVGLINLT